jgi:NAD(P)-dependent dehydrogenase (short-subunit alcohol dehydrogenase family)
VRDEGAVAALVDAAWRELGAIDLLCANAGVVTSGSILDTRREQLDWIFGVNVFGIVNACRPYVAKLRAEHRGGQILMTGSETSLSHPAFLRSMPIHAYLMTKHCVLALADSLRCELESEGIGVSVLCPGSTATGLAQNSAELRPAAGSAATRAQTTLPDIAPNVARSMAEMNRTPDQVAEKALEGLRKGLFVITTHAHIRADAEARWREIERSFEALGLA